MALYKMLKFKMKVSYQRWQFNLSKGQLLHNAIYKTVVQRQKMAQHALQLSDPVQDIRRLSLTGLFLTSTACCHSTPPHSSPVQRLSTLSFQLTVSQTGPQLSGAETPRGLGRSSLYCIVMSVFLIVKIVFRHHRNIKDCHVSTVTPWESSTSPRNIFHWHSLIFNMVQIVDYLLYYSGHLQSLLTSFS